MCRPSILTFGMCFVLGGFGFCPRAVRGAISTIAVTGQQAAGLSAGVQYRNDPSSFTHLLSSSGEIAFSAVLTGTGVTSSNNNAIWAGTPGALSVVARTGDPAPGMPSGVVFNGLQLGPFLSDGRITFWGTVSGPDIDATNQNAIWRGQPGDLHLVARSGDPAPGTGTGVTFDYFYGGSRVLRAFLKGPGVTSQNDEGYWVVGDNGMTLLAREGDQAPGAPAGVDFSMNNFFAGSYFDAGQGPFRASLTGPGVTSDNDVGFWYTDSGVTSLLIRSGDPAPGAGAGVTFRLHGSNSFGAPVFSAGQIAFQTQLAGPGITGANDNSIWVGPPDNITLRVRDGQTAPGTTVPFSRLQQPHLNEAGDFAFESGLDTPNFDDESGIWLTHGGTTQLVARQGQVAPGSGGWFFASLNGQLLAINSAGQVAFAAGVDPTSGYGNPSIDKRGIWIDNAGQLNRIAGSGDVLAGRSVQSVYFNQEGDFNAAGQLAFVARFDSTGTSQGLFLYDPLSVPEPCSSATCLILLVQIICLRKKKRSRLPSSSNRT